MKIYRLICDLCGVQIPNDQRRFYANIGSGDDGAEGDWIGINAATFTDLCEDCRRSIRENLKHLSKHREEMLERIRKTGF